VSEALAKYGAHAHEDWGIEKDHWQALSPIEQRFVMGVVGSSPYSTTIVA